MLKILCFGDSHLGYTLKKKKLLRKYSLSNFKKILDKVIETKANWIFFAGDIFDIEISVSPDSNNLFLEVISKILLLDHVEKIFMISGNHDPLSIYYDASVGSMINFLKNDKIIYTDNDTVFYCDDKRKVTVSLIPFNRKYWFQNEETKKFKIEESIETIIFDNLQNKTDYYNIFCSHFAISDWMPFGKYSLSLEDMPSKRFNAMILGDLHASGLEHYYTDNNILFYTGALFHRSLDDLYQYECQGKYFEVENGMIQNFKALNFPKPEFIKTDKYIENIANPKNSIVLVSNLEAYQKFQKDDILHVELINKEALESDLKNILKLVFTENDSNNIDVNNNAKKFIKHLVNNDERLLNFSLSVLDIDINNLTKKDLILKIKELI